MDLDGRVVVVTGAARGMGAAMCRRLADEGAQVVAADVDGPGVELLGKELDCPAFRTDVRLEHDVQALVAETTVRLGRVDVFVSNAGVLWGEPHDGSTPLQDRGNVWASDRAWQECWQTNVMSQVYAARAVLPQMIARGDGYLVQNASAGGLLTAMGNAPYTTSKHAAVGLTEWLAIHHGHQGIKVSCIVAEGVRTDMLRGAQGEWFAVAGAIEPEEAADRLVEGLHAERFLILTHPKVPEYFQGKASDYDGWLAKMRRLHAKTPKDG